MQREEIVAEIKRLAATNGGAPPGSASFSKMTGISEGKWRGVYWARWGDAVREAGFEPNEYKRAYSADEICEHFLDFCRDLGRVPTLAEIKLYAAKVQDAPSHSVWTRQFGGKDGLVAAARDYAVEHPNYADTLQILPSIAIEHGQNQQLDRADEGWVYLLKSGGFHKIGRSDNIEKRIKQIAISLPEEVVLVHAIKTDDPPGIEAYWHNRFATERAKGEWFKLDKSQIRAFKRRKFM